MMNDWVSVSFKYNYTTATITTIQIRRTVQWTPMNPEGKLNSQEWWQWWRRRRQQRQHYSWANRYQRNEMTTITKNKKTNPWLLSLLLSIVTWNRWENPKGNSLQRRTDTPTYRPPLCATLERQTLIDLKIHRYCYSPKEEGGRREVWRRMGRTTALYCCFNSNTGTITSRLRTKLSA